MTYRLLEALVGRRSESTDVTIHRQFRLDAVRRSPPSFVGSIGEGRANAAQSSAFGAAHHRQGSTAEPSGSATIFEDEYLMELTFDARR